MINVITISREYGSGGRCIGEKIAKELGIPFYDKVLIDMIASESGMDVGYVENVVENLSMAQAFDIAASGYYTVSPFLDTTQVVSESVFTTQSKIIRKIADQGPCVIVGRCAEYILKDREDCLNVFIHADMDDKIKRVRDSYGIEEKKVISTIKKSDKARAKHYAFYCEEKWGLARNYDLSFNSSKFGEEGVVNIIKRIVESEKF
ncbi:MAG: cytidylate kinase-like family protein [Anaerovoracaceae bacterium]